MIRELGASRLRAISDRLAVQMGLYFPENRLSDLERGLASAAVEMNVRGAAACGDLIMSQKLSQRQIETLAAHLTVSETYFFRDALSFESLGQSVLPQLSSYPNNSRRNLRIWCAGCSSGEEPYSIAITLLQSIPNILDWEITILGTDINPVALQKAINGEYREWSFRSTPKYIRDLYFEPAGDRAWRITDEVRQMVTFAYLNLAGDGYPSIETNTSAMDVVFCRNVLMYFSPEQTRAVAERLQRAVAPEGWLFVGASEASRALFPQLKVVDGSGAILFQKSSFPRPANDGLQGAGTLPARPRDLPDPVVAVDAPGGDRHRPSTTPEDRVTGREQSPEERAQAELSRARALWAAGRPVEAEGIAMELLKRHEDSEACELLARICANDGRTVLGLEWCDRAIGLDRLNASLRFLKASILQELGDAEGAVRILKEVLYVEPSHVLAHYALANQYRRMGRPKEATLHFRNAMGLLSTYDKSELLSGAEGITAGRLSEIIRSAASADHSTHAGGSSE